MKQVDFKEQSNDYLRIEKAVRYIEGHHAFQPSLDRIAESVNMERADFDRVFKRWAGIRPDRFMHYLTLEYTKEKLFAYQSIPHVSLDAGLSRLHDTYVSFDTISPGEYKKRGKGIHITFGCCNTPFGNCLIAKTHRGICHLGFITEGNTAEEMNALQAKWSESTFTENAKSFQKVVEEIFDMKKTNLNRPFHLLLKGTNFQVNVWRALLSIPSGHVASYSDIAQILGAPKSVRAVSTAISKNSVAWLIPCHRVISSSGKIHKYRWGNSRKKIMLGWEASRTDN